MSRLLRFISEVLHTIGKQIRTSTDPTGKLLNATRSLKDSWYLPIFTEEWWITLLGKFPEWFDSWENWMGLERCAQTSFWVEETHNWDTHFCPCTTSNCTIHCRDGLFTPGDWSCTLPMSLTRAETVVAYSSHKLQPSLKLYPPHERDAGSCESLERMASLLAWPHLWPLLLRQSGCHTFWNSHLWHRDKLAGYNSSQSTISTSITYLERTTLQLTHSAVALTMSLPATIHRFQRKNSNCGAHARCKTRSTD